MSVTDGPKEACKTYIEQTKLLVTLASAFVVAPAALVPLFRGQGAVIVTDDLLSHFFRAELAFVFSVLSGYVVLATIAGYQHLNRFDVHRLSTRLSSLAQIAAYGIGLWQFIRFVEIMMSAGPSPGPG